MRRFTPTAASPAINNYGGETLVDNTKLQDQPAREDLRSPISAFSAARLISNA
jgi:hypothetical protein